ncbi:MAG: hypothetical protein RL295_1940 [Pseudomonadota bacterium]|jgi:hypothetical protein
MKRLQRYYLYIGIPIVLIALGSVYFQKEIMGTIEGNPHPQINYLILLLIVGGCLQMLGHVRRINREAQLIEDFSQSLLTSRNLQQAQELLQKDKASQSHDVVEVLELVLHNFDTTIGGVQQTAIESEIERFHARQNRRLLLAQFMSGMMVGLGLLGTFIGLLGALQEIGKLIGSFSVGSGMTDPVAAVNELVSRLTEPMRAMGVAFSASLFGVLGSLIMGMLMVFIKSATVELVSMLQSRSSLLTKLGQDSSSVDAEASQLSQALSKLAENSPVLQGLIVAMDQSERRVRSMLNAMQELVVQMKDNSSQQTEVQHQIAQLGGQHQQVLSSIENIRTDTLEAAKAAAKTTEIQRQSLQILESEQELLKTSIGKNSELVSLTMDMQSRWLDQQHEQQVALNKSTISTAEQVAQERAGWLDQLRTWFQSTQSQQNHLQDLNDRIEKVIAILFEQSRQNTEFQEHMLTDQARMIEQGSAVNQLLQLMGQRAKDEQVSRTEMAHQLKMVFTDQQERHEQLISTLVNTLTAGVSGNKLNHSESAIAGTTEMSAAAVPPDKRPPANP